MAVTFNIRASEPLACILIKDGPLRRCYVISPIHKAKKLIIHTKHGPLRKGKLLCVKQHAPEER